MQHLAVYTGEALEELENALAARAGEKAVVVASFPADH
jgi:hypothetical protein